MPFNHPLDHVGSHSVGSAPKLTISLLHLPEYRSPVSSNTRSRFRADMPAPKLRRCRPGNHAPPVVLLTTIIAHAPRSPPPCRCCTRKALAPHHHGYRPTGCVRSINATFPIIVFSAIKWPTAAGIWHHVPPRRPCRRNPSHPFQGCDCSLRIEAPKL